MKKLISVRIDENTSILLKDVMKYYEITRTDVVLQAVLEYWKPIIEEKKKELRDVTQMGHQNSSFLKYLSNINSNKGGS